MFLNVDVGKILHVFERLDRFLNFPVSRRFHYYYITLQAFLSKTRQRYDQ